MKLYDAAALAALGYHCITVMRRVIPPIGGKWIPYTAAEVAARRAAQMVPVVVCCLVPVPAEAPPMPPPAITGPPLVLVPPRVGHRVGPGDNPIHTPEPASALVLAVGLAALWVGRR